MNDSLHPTAPGLDEPLEILEACHGRIEQQLRTLEKMLDHLPRHGADTQARQAAMAVMRYFDTAGRHHHADEEEDLFPRLRQRITEATQLERTLAELLAQHQRMEAAWRALRIQLEAVTQGDADALERGAVTTFADLYRQHVARENAEIFPLAARVLTTQDIEALSRAMTARRRIT